MTICAVIDLSLDRQVNTIVAEETDVPPEGCKLIAIPEGYVFINNRLELIPIEEPTDGN